MMRNLFLGALALTTAMAGCGVDGKTDPNEDFTDLSALDDKSDAFSKKMKIVGSLSYGETSALVQYSNPPLFRAFKLAGNKGDKVEALVRSKKGDAIAWLLDDSFKTLAHNDDANGSLDSHLVATLPGNRRPEIVTYYIVFRDYYKTSASFTVELKGPSKDFYACDVDADCQKVLKGCCDIAGWTAVNAGQAAAYRSSLSCPTPTICPAIAVPFNNQVAQCLPSAGGATKSCQLVKPEDINCGGHVLPGQGHECPANWSCKGDALAWDGTGKCYQFCGGIAGFQCDGGGNNCVDDPNDSCDPANGGADCGGFCHQCGNVSFRCAPGYHTDWLNCTCAKDPTPTDCRTTGCDTGRYCTFCWTNYACIPNGALC